jgi:cell division protein FtsN
MLRRIFLSCALIFCAVSRADAQSAARSAEMAFTRAQELASDGNSAAGRALVDSVIKATSPTSPIYPQALFWRATLATNAADAESDYRHIVVDYPLAPQAEDALLRLAQLELARGDREDALVHLQRISRDYPRSKSLARASYWTARVLFEKNDIAGACAANANAMSQTAESEIELRNQIQYQSQRCASHAAAQRVATNPIPPAQTQPAASSTTTASTPAAMTVKPPANAADSSPPAVATASPVQVPPTRPMTPPTKGRDTEPSLIEPKPPVPSAAGVKNTAPSGTRTYSVQVAAYNKKPQAEKLVASLEERGYEARVDGTEAPFRVRIGRYASAREAEVALKEIKSKRMAGFVVRAP